MQVLMKLLIELSPKLQENTMINLLIILLLKLLSLSFHLFNPKIWQKLLMFTLSEEKV